MTHEVTVLFQAASDPLFTNDLTGFVKILSIMVALILLPLAALVIYFLKRGPDNDIANLRRDMKGFGERLNADETRMTRLEETVNMLGSQIVESQRDVMAAIQASAEQQLRAVHAVDIQVARLQERNDLGK